jgi:anti-sigma factor RsiW
MMTQEEEDQAIATLTDYVEGTLPADRKKEVEAKLAADEDWKRIHGEISETAKPDAISAVLKARKAPAPEDFNTNVEEKIHKRSAGRFFGRKTFGDRVPFSALLVVAVLVLMVIGYVMWSSQTGSLKVDKKGSGDAPGSAIEVVPKP